MTIKDIARLAGVAVSTVSRVLNDHPDVSEATRLHVLGVIEAHNYIPNNSARNLKRMNAPVIGILIKGRDNPFFSQVIEAIEDVTAKAGYSPIIHYHQTEGHDADVAIELIKEKRLKGLVCLGGDFTLEASRALTHLNVPVVLTSTDWNGSEGEGHLSTVSIRNEVAAYEAVTYLIGRGHRRIGLIATSEEDTSIGRLRLLGYKRALATHGILFDPYLVRDADYSLASGYESARSLLTLNDRPTALFAISDMMAIGAGKAVTDMGLSIPHDVSLMGFDGLEIGNYMTPPLTTMVQPVYEMGRASAEVLLDMISHKITSKHVVLETQMLIRGSVNEVSSA